MAKLFCFSDSLAKTTEGLMYKSQEAFGKRFLDFPNFVFVVGGVTCLNKKDF